MATTFNWSAPSACMLVMTTELNALANGAYSAVGSAVYNSASRHLYASVELYLASTTPACNNAAATVYFNYALSGSNYADGGGATEPEGANLAAVFDLRTSTGTQRLTRGNILLQPFDFKPILLNNGGSALAGSGNTVTIWLYDEVGN